MLRSYRCVLAALVGLGLSAAIAPNQKPKADEGRPESDIGAQLERIATTLQKPPVTPTPDGGCPDGQPDYQSDLCAQWQAAIAARDGADWAWWTMFCGFLGVAIGGGTLFAAWRAAHWAKKAADHTDKGAVAAIEAVEQAKAANRISLETSNTETRPHILLESIDIPILAYAEAPQSFAPNIWVSFKNWGSSPAWIEWHDLGYTAGGVPQPNHEWSAPYYANAVVVPPGVVWNVNIRPPVLDFCPEEITQITQGNLSLNVFRKVIYRDMHGQRHEIVFCSAYLMDGGALIGQQPIQIEGFTKYT